MEDIAEFTSRYPGITETYEILRTVEIVVATIQYRIELVERRGGEEKFYDTIVWRYERKALDETILVKYMIPWLHEVSPELALYRTIKYLATGDI